MFVLPAELCNITPSHEQNVVPQPVTRPSKNVVFKGLTLSLSSSSDLVLPSNHLIYVTDAITRCEKHGYQYLMVFVSHINSNQN
jgi:hypothetical protein